MLNFCFLTQKRHIIERNHVVWRISRENLFRGLCCGPLEEPGKKPSKYFWCAISRIWGKETHWGIVTRFCMWVDIRDVITCAYVGDDRLRGLGVAGGRISHFPIDLRRLTCVVALTTLSHYRASVIMVMLQALCMGHCASRALSCCDLGHDIGIFELVVCCWISQQQVCAKDILISIKAQFYVFFPAD